MSPKNCARLRLAPFPGLREGRWYAERWTSHTGAGRKEVGILKMLISEVKLDSC